MKKHIRTRRMPDGRLPKNRTELFFDALRWRFSFLVSTGLLLLLSALPHMAALMYYDISAAVISREAADGMSDALAALQLQTSLIQIPTFTLLCVGIGGVLYLLRRLAWREHTEIFGGFFRGIRSGWKHYVLLGVGIGLARLLCNIARTMFYGFTRYLPDALYLFAVVPTALYALTLEAVYRKRFGNLLSSAVVLYIRTVPFTLLFVLLCMAPELLLAIPRFSLRYGLFTAAVVLVLPVVLFGWTLYAHGIFDKWINRENYPDLCGRGIDTQKR